MFKTILLPTDGSELSNKAVQAGIEFAKSNGSKVIGLSVAEIYPYFPVSAMGGGEDLGLYAEAAQRQAEMDVKRIADLALKAGLEYDTCAVQGVSPHDEIIKTAEKYHCDIIFMASHGRKGLEQFLLGSETQKVLAHSKIPVLVFR